MNSPHMRHMRHLWEQWRAESAAVRDDAIYINLQRTRMFAPILAAVSACMGLLLLVLTVRTPEDDSTFRWKLWHLILLIVLSLFWTGCGMAAKALRHSHRMWTGRYLGITAMLLSMGISLALVYTAQWMAPSITAFFVNCTLISLMLYLPATQAFLLIFGCYGALFVILGWAQPDAQYLLTTRIDGLAISCVAWGVSLMQWQKFTSIVLQRRELTKTNAELQQKQKELERLTRQDGLTGLFNRSTFVELSRSELKRAQRQGSTTTILLLDLDHFKRINDTWGHPAGDAVLRCVATLASSTLRSTDLVGRLGGEEFIVLLPNTSIDAGRRLADKLRLRLQSAVVEWDGNRIPVTASFGLSSTTPAENRDFDYLYTEADKALYLAKQRGRNRVV